MSTKPTQGGKRAGAGRKPIYNEKTKPYSVCLPISKREEIIKQIQLIIKKYKAK